MADSLRLAQLISELPSDRVETVAWIDGEARGDAALIAMACDERLMKPKSVLGGPGEATIRAQDVLDLEDQWLQLARRKEREAVEFYGLLTPEIELTEYTHRRGRVEWGWATLFERRLDAAEWTAGKEQTYPQGMTPEQAIAERWVDDTSGDLMQVAARWDLRELPAPKRVGALEHFLQNLANQEWLLTMLVAAGFICFSREMTTPGIGVYGFLSAACFLAFFWLRFLDGTVEWLEILLCVGGMVALAIELFILPGFGIFGIGGFIMLATGLILASQTFVVPRNDYQWGKLAGNSMQVAIACGIVMALAVVFRHHIERLPFVRWLKLAPPPADAPTPPSHDASWESATGTTTTRCAPWGMAMIRGELRQVHAANELIETGTPIIVTGTRGNTLEISRHGA